MRVFFWILKTLQPQAHTDCLIRYTGAASVFFCLLMNFALTYLTKDEFYNDSLCRLALHFSYRYVRRVELELYDVFVTL